MTTPGRRVAGAHRVHGRRRVDGGRFGLRLRPRCRVGPGPADDAVGGEVVASAIKQVRHVGEADAEVERRAGQGRRGGDREIAVVDDLDPMAGGGCRPPEGQVRCPLGAVDTSGGDVPLRHVVDRRADGDGIARADRALADHARVHPAVVGVRRDAEAAVTMAVERAADRPARVGRPGQLDDHLVSDRQTGADRQGRDVEALGREILAGRAGRDGVALVRDPADRLDTEERDRAMRAAMDGGLGLAITLDPERRDARGRDRPLRDAAGRDVDLEKPPALHGAIVARGYHGHRPLGNAVSRSGLEGTSDLDPIRQARGCRCRRDLRPDRRGRPRARHRFGAGVPRLAAVLWRLGASRRAPCLDRAQPPPDRGRLRRSAGRRSRPHHGLH